MYKTISNIPNLPLTESAKKTSHTPDWLLFVKLLATFFPILAKEHVHCRCFWFWLYVSYHALAMFRYYLRGGKKQNKKLDVGSWWPKIRTKVVSFYFCSHLTVVLVLRLLHAHACRCPLQSLRWFVCNWLVNRTRVCFLNIMEIENNSQRKFHVT